MAHYGRWRLVARRTSSTTAVMGSAGPPRRLSNACLAQLRRYPRNQTVTQYGQRYRGKHLEWRWRKSGGRRLSKCVSRSG